MQLLMQTLLAEGSKRSLGEAEGEVSSSPLDASGFLEVLVAGEVSGNLESPERDGLGLATKQEISSVASDQIDVSRLLVAETEGEPEPAKFDDASIPPNVSAASLSGGQDTGAPGSQVIDTDASSDDAAILSKENLAVAAPSSVPPAFDPEAQVASERSGQNPIDQKQSRSASALQGDATKVSSVNAEIGDGSQRSERLQANLDVTPSDRGSSTEEASKGKDLVADAKDLTAKTAVPTELSEDGRQVQDLKREAGPTGLPLSTERDQRTPTGTQPVAAGAVNQNLVDAGASKKPLRDDGRAADNWKTGAEVAKADLAYRSRGGLPNKSDATTGYTNAPMAVAPPAVEKSIASLGALASGGGENLVSETQILRPDEVARTITSEASRPEPVAARSIVNQVIHVVSRTQAEGVFEIRLQPEELGRVRLTLAPSEAGVSVQISAERSETLDLLRRNIDLLESELKDRGFTDMSFSFGSDGNADHSFQADKGQTEDGSEGDATEGVTVELTTPRILPIYGTLDIRV